MKKRMVGVFLACSVSFVGAAFAQQSSTRATRAEDIPVPQLVCQVYPYPSAPSQSCGPAVPQGVYSAVFNELNLPDGSYGYSWYIPHVHGIVAKYGCTTGANCTVQYRGMADDFDADATVTATNLSTGKQYVLTAHFSAPATCNGGYNGYHWC